jgi:glycosyltransferase involved in cell wall biosynthesis
VKILHVISQRPDSTGSGVYLQAILRESFARGHSNSLIAAVNTDTLLETATLWTENTSLVTFGTEELDFPLPGMSDVMPYPSSVFSSLSSSQIRKYEKVFLAKLSEQIASFSPDIIHSHHLWLLTALIGRYFPDIPLVTNCHGSDLRQFRICPSLQQRVKEGCRNIDLIFALTESQRDEIISLFGHNTERISICGSGFNDALFEFKEKVPPPPIHVTYCGKLSRAKGVPWLLQAMYRLRNIPFHLNIVGGVTGAEGKECLQLAKRLEKKVTMHGPLSQSNLALLLQESHVLVLPSFYEGLPLVILEALACGCRVVTTDLPGCRIIAEKIDRNIITSVPLPRLHTIDTPFAQDEESFIDALQDGLENTFQKCIQDSLPGKGDIARYMSQFTWQEIFTTIECGYNSLHH